MSSRLSVPAVYLDRVARSLSRLESGVVPVLSFSLMSVAERQRVVGVRLRALSRERAYNFGSASYRVSRREAVVNMDLRRFL